MLSTGTTGSLLTNKTCMRPHSRCSALLGPQLPRTRSACRYERHGHAPAHTGAPARVLVPLSGGVDSTVVAALAHACLPPGEPVDLVNVCFAAGASPDRVAALDALRELRAVAPGRQWRLITVDSTLDEVDTHHDQCAPPPPPLPALGL